MDDFFKIDIPVFLPSYKLDEKYGWTNHKDNLWKILRETTGGYCMYCYDSIWINQQKRGQIEHGIEKANSVERLSDCIPNLGIACEICNGSYKRRGEAKRKLPKELIQEFEHGVCKKYDCKEPCDRYKKIRREYIKRGKILLQPFESKKKEGRPNLRLQYDLLKCRYIPSEKHGRYDKEELEIIEGHINVNFL